MKPHFLRLSLVLMTSLLLTLISSLRAEELLKGLRQQLRDRFPLRQNGQGTT